MNDKPCFQQGGGRGEVVTRIARGFLALCSLFGMLLGANGCRKAPLLPALPVRYVRLDALLPLHPAWAQVALLDRTVKRFRAESVAPSVTLEPLAPAPSTFAPPPSSHPQLVTARQERIRQDALRYLRQLEQSLNASDSLLVNRQERVERKRVQQDVARERTRLTEGLQTEARHQSLDIARQIDRLQFRLVALKSQLNVYTDQPLQDAQVQYTLVLNQIAALRQQRRDVLARVGPEAERQVRALMPGLEAASRARVEQLRDRLAAARAQKIARERDNLETQVTPIPAVLSDPPPLPPDARETALALPTSADAAHSMGQGSAQVSAALARQNAVWEQQRKRLLAVIRADTQQAVTQIARKQGWRLVSSPTRGASDATHDVTDALAAQWRHGATQ